MPTDTVPIRIDRPLMEASICCPACGYHCACTGWVDWVEVRSALFVCRGCAVRYYLDLPPSNVLRAESLAPAEGAA